MCCGHESLTRAFRWRRKVEFVSLVSTLWLKFPRLLPVELRVWLKSGSCAFCAACASSSDLDFFFFELLKNRFHLKIKSLFSCKNLYQFPKCVSKRIILLLIFAECLHFLFNIALQPKASDFHQNFSKFKPIKVEIVLKWFDLNWFDFCRLFWWFDLVILKKIESDLVIWF